MVPSSWQKQRGSTDLHGTRRRIKQGTTCVGKKKGGTTFFLPKRCSRAFGTLFLWAHTVTTT